MKISLILFLIGVLGFTLNRKNLILIIIAIELILLAVTLLVIISAQNFNDAFGQTYSVLIIAVAAAESAIGLSILVANYRINGTLNLTRQTLLFNCILL